PGKPVPPRRAGRTSGRSVPRPAGRRRDRNRNRARRRLSLLGSTHQCWFQSPKFPGAWAAQAGIIAPVIRHQAASFAIKPTLSGTNVLLRPFVFDQDAPALREMLQDPEVMRLTGSAHGPGELELWDGEAESRFRDWYGTRNDQTDRLDLAVVDKASGE